MPSASSRPEVTELDGGNDAGTGNSETRPSRHARQRPSAASPSRPLSGRRRNFQLSSCSGSLPGSGRHSPPTSCLRPSPRNCSTTWSPSCTMPPKRPSCRQTRVEPDTGSYRNRWRSARKNTPSRAMWMSQMSSKVSSSPSSGLNRPVRSWKRSVPSASGCT